MDLVQELKDALRECADDLEAEINSRYKDSAGHIHPALQRKYDRDIEPVKKARLLIVGPLAER